MKKVGEDNTSPLGGLNHEPDFAPFPRRGDRRQLLDTATVRNHATYENPQQYSTGIVHVWANGEQVIDNGEHTGAMPGRVVRGPGWKGD